jgi:hypothetical protein
MLPAPPGPSRLKRLAPSADLPSMGRRSPIYLCGMLGMFVGGYVPTLWGASSFSLSSLLFSGVGGVAGVWFGVRFADN